MPAKQEIHAVHADDRMDLLLRLGLAEDYDQGRLKCRICGRTLREHGIGSVQMKDGCLEFACADFGCSDQQLEEG